MEHEAITAMSVVPRHYMYEPSKTLGTIMATKRDYKSEYANYHGQPEQIKKRA
jgi:hypothetical protein